MQASGSGYNLYYFLIDEPMLRSRLLLLPPSTPQKTRANDMSLVSTVQPTKTCEFSTVKSPVLFRIHRTLRKLWKVNDVVTDKFCMGESCDRGLLLLLTVPSNNGVYYLDPLCGSVGSIQNSHLVRVKDESV
mmetsp:Transcript_22455/g.53005  ORF Transcript_22455/g.53005 Transcript_22455/m.53005 type:complete len:132 (-) Transcript_22455:1138-1533(-)